MESDEKGADPPHGSGSTDPVQLYSTHLGESPCASATRVIGPYHLLEQIGVGGMGEVWLAEQRRPVQRRVALKLVKAGMDSASVLARFDSERQALALMDHPSIARIFEAGSTPEGRPYFVMEHVVGDSITKHCKRNRLTTRERLDLFLQVCDGVQHAHQKAVIHRDLKPSNVLVSVKDGQATPKIIDFGLAKALSNRLTDQTLHTEIGVLVGTPEYMSPEQAERSVEDVDTRTDVYSLGVILYELLAGALPFDSRRLREAGYGGIPKILREEDPPSPSARISHQSQEVSAESARDRNSDLVTLKRQLVGDLDRITMKALEKDRARRYGSAAELAEDVRRHLRHEPVLARPPTARYRTTKFVRRYRMAVLSAGVVTLGLALGIVGTTVGLIRARRAEAAAHKDAETANRVAGFLSGILGSVDPHRMGTLLIDDLKERAARAVPDERVPEQETAAGAASVDRALAGLAGTDTARRILDDEILKRAGEAIDAEFSGAPMIAARLHQTIGQTYLSLGMYDTAERYALRALEIRGRLLGAEHPDALDSQALLGRVRYRQGRYGEAADLQSETLEARIRVLGPEDRETLRSTNDLAFTLRAEGEYEKAEGLYQKNLAAERRVLGLEDPQTLSTMNDFGFLYLTMGRYEEAERMHRENLEIRTRVLGEEHRDTLWSIYNLGWASLALGRHEEASRLFSRCLEIRRRILGRDHPDTLFSLYMLARVRYEQGRFEEAERLQRETLEAQRHVLGAEHPDTLISLHFGATIAYRLGRLADCRRFQEVVLAGRRRVLGEDHVNTLASIRNLRWCYWAGGWQEEARRLDRDMLGVWRNAAQREGATVMAKLGYAAALLDGGRAAGSEAEEAVRYALEAAEASEFGDAAVLYVLALGYSSVGKMSDAVATQKKAIALLEDYENPLRSQWESRLAAFIAATKSSNSAAARG